MRCDGRTIDASLFLRERGNTVAAATGAPTMYDQQKEDPNGFNLSVAAIAGLVAIGAALGHVWALAVIGALVCGWFVREARKATGPTQ